MNLSRFKILFCAAVCFAMLSAPFALDITLDGKAHAFSSRSGNTGQFNSGPNSGANGTQTSWSHYKPLQADEQSRPHTPHPVPEPGTMLLVGAGLAGLAIFRRKFKK